MIFEKNKIVILSDTNFPYGSPAANYLRNFSMGLKCHSKYDIEVWLQSGNSRPDCNFIKKRKGFIKDISFIYIGGFIIRPRKIIGMLLDDLIGFLNSILKVLKEKKSINTIVVYNNSSIRIIFPLLICKLLKIKIIKIVPEWYEKSSIVTSYMKYFKWWDFILGIKKTNLIFDGLIVLSYYFYEYYISLKYDPQKITILPNLVDIDEFAINIQKKEEKNLIIGYSGTPVKKDGIIDLLNAFKLLLEKHSYVTLLIIGDISQKKTTIPHLKRKAREINIPENRIKFTGLVDFEKIPGLLKSCDILVLSRPSGQFAEAGFPTKVGEYLACIKPVVLTKIGDIPRYFVDKFNAILVEPDSPESISEGLIYLVEHPDKSREIANEGYKWAKLNLEYKTVMAKVLLFMQAL